MQNYSLAEDSPKPAIDIYEIKKVTYKWKMSINCAKMQQIKIGSLSSVCTPKLTPLFKRVQQVFGTSSLAPSFHLQFESTEF